LLVTEFFAGATELGEADVDQGVIDDGLGIIRKLWDAGLAHRDIKPANLLVRDGRMMLIDVAFVESRPSPWRQAVDLANMMLCLALRSTPELVYQRALRLFSVEEISEAFAATRGLTMPSQLRHLIRAQGRDLHTEFFDLLPARPRPVSIQRWSVRRVGLALMVLLGLAVVIPMVVSWSVQSDRVDTSLYSDVDCESREPLWLMAQAVPSASLVPCVQLLPVGWTLADVDTDRAGAAAVVVELTASCDLAGATEVTSEQSGARRYLRVDRNGPKGSGTRVYTFPGGCVTQRFRGAGPSAFRLTDTASVEFGFISREQLGQALSQRSGGRLTLDAAAR
jgi:serine/threonine protein kinase